MTSRFTLGSPQCFTIMTTFPGAASTSGHRPRPRPGGPGPGQPGAPELLRRPMARRRPAGRRRPASGVVARRCPAGEARRGPLRGGIAGWCVAVWPRRGAQAEDGLEVPQRRRHLPPARAAVSRPEPP